MNNTYLWTPESQWFSEYSMKYAMENKIDITKVVPTGVGGKIMLRDILNMEEKFYLDTQEKRYSNKPFFSSNSAKKLASKHNIHPYSIREYLEEMTNCVSPVTHIITKNDIKDFLQFSNNYNCSVGELYSSMKIEADIYDNM